MGSSSGTRSKTIALLSAMLLFPSALQAQSCGSVGKWASVVWDTYLEGAREAGCLSPVQGPRKALACSINVPIMTAHLVDKVIGLWNSAAQGGWATFGPRRLGPSFQTGTLWGTTGRTFLGSAPVHSTTTVTIEKLDGSAPAEVVVCATREDGSTRQLASHRFDRGKDNLGEGPKTFTFSDLASDLVSVKIDAKDWVPTNKFRYRVKLNTEPIEYDEGPVEGFADLHLHQAAELGFGGNQLWGSHIGPQSEALPMCGPETVPGEVAQSLPLPRINTLHGILPFNMSFGEGEARHGHGAPGLEDWPHFNDVLHQQVHEDWLKDAHDQGLNLVVVSAVNFQGLCFWLKAIYPRPGDRMGCLDMDAVRRQLQAFIDMDEKRDWYEIAVHPWHARKIIHEGKLAVVLSMEVSRLFPTVEGDFVTQLGRLRGMGLRTLQLAHETDSRFAGAAPHRDLFEAFQALKWHGRASADRAVAAARGEFIGELAGFRYDENGKNAAGLSPKGVELVEAMIDRRMLIDAAHLSERSMSNLYQLVAKEHSYYPLYDSHTRFEAVLTDDDREVQQEFLTTDPQIELLRATGGMVGLRTGQNEILTVTTQNGDHVPNHCPGSSASFAQLVHYGSKAGIPMGFGTDFNGFINQLGPRFGDERCPAADPPRSPRMIPTEAEDIVARKKAIAAAPPDECNAAKSGEEAGRDFDIEGLRHVGYLPDLVADLEEQATPGVEILKSSAEAFLRMWERAYDPNRTRVEVDDHARRTAADVPEWNPCGLARQSGGALAFLEGNWLRVDSNNSLNDGMRISVTGDRAKLTGMPRTGRSPFGVGQILWQDITDDGRLEVRGSNARYYGATLTMEGENRVHVDIDEDPGPGYEQTWERAGPSIDGEWVLVAPGASRETGLKIRVEGDRASVRYVPPSASRGFRVGAHAWRDIGAGEERHIGRLEALVANRSYETARFRLLDENRLRLVIDSDGAAQIWARPGVAEELLSRGEAVEARAHLDQRPSVPSALAVIAGRRGVRSGFDDIQLSTAMEHPAVIIGTVFHDRDGDGTRDDGEEGIPHVSVEVLVLSSGERIAVHTDGEGRYRYEQATDALVRISTEPESLPFEAVLTTRPPEYEIEASRGYAVPGVSFGFLAANSDATPPARDSANATAPFPPVESGVTAIVGVVPEGAYTRSGVPSAPAGRPVRIRSLDDFEARFATWDAPSSRWNESDREAFRTLHRAVRGFFANGGTTAWVVRATSRADLEDPSDELESLRHVEVDVVIVPGATARAQHEAILDHVASTADRVALLDGRLRPKRPTASEIRATDRRSDRAVLLFPALVVESAPDGEEILQASSGHVAGVLARSDRERGIHRPPADLPIVEAIRPAISLPPSSVDSLNIDGILVLRETPDGVRTWGARTTAGSGDDPFRYLSIRRAVDQTEQTLSKHLREQTCEQARSSAEAYLLDRWREGALQGTKPAEAFYVRCQPGDESLRSGLALIRPGEFIPLTIPLDG